VVLLLCLVGAADTAQFNCQVCRVRLLSNVYYVLTGHDPQVESIFLYVSLPSDTLGLSS